MKHVPLQPNYSTIAGTDPYARNFAPELGIKLFAVEVIWLFFDAHGPLLRESYAQFDCRASGSEPVSRIEFRMIAGGDQLEVR